MNRPRITWPAIVIVSLLGTAVFAQRLYVQFNIGERQPAILEILPVWLPVLAVVATIRSRGQNLAAFRSRDFLLIWAPYLALALVLPAIGVLLGQYPLRGLAAVRTPVIATSALILGAELRVREPRGILAWGGPLMIAAGAQAAYAVLQQVIAGHLLPAGPWDLLFRWDISTQQDYGRGLVVGRSSAFYTNPNILGAWAAVAMLVGLLAARGRDRYVVVAAALAALVLSQSRGASLALIVSLLFMLLLTRRRPVPDQLHNLLRYGAVVSAVLAGWVILAAVGAPVGNLLNRLGEGIGVLLGGQDPNFAGRFRFWAAGMTLLREHPLGTFGPPEVLLGTAIDSEWVKALLQGGPIYLAALGAALIGGTLARGDDSSERRVVRSLSLFIAVAGLTQIPLQYPPAVLYWAFVGSSLVAPASRVGKEGVPRGDPPIRILMVATIARTLETFMPPHVAALRARGWRVDGIANGLAGSQRAGSVFDTVWEVGWSRRPISLGNLRAIRRIREVVAAGGYQIVHVQTPVAAFITRFALRGLGDRRPAIVYTAHGFHFHRNAGWLRNVAYGTLERTAGRWTDELVVVNDDDANEAVRRGVMPLQHVHCIPGVGIDTVRFDPGRVSPEAALEARRAIGLPDGLPMIITIAEINRNKNIPHLVAALARMQREAHLVVIGNGPELERVRRAIYTLGVSDRVHLVGYVPDVRPLLRAASVFALVSLREGLPNSMMEAMSIGVPVVGTDTRGIRDLAADGRGEIVPLYAPDLLAQALDRIIGDPEAAAVMARRARDYVVAELDIKSILSAYAVVYEAALRHRPEAA